MTFHKAAWQWAELYPNDARFVVPIARELKEGNLSPEQALYTMARCRQCTTDAMRDLEEIVDSGAGPVVIGRQADDFIRCVLPADIAGLREDLTSLHLPDRVINILCLEIRTLLHNLSHEVIR